MAREYKINLELASGVNLEVLFFSNKEHRWIFRHHYRFPEKLEKLQRPTLLNNILVTI